MSPHTDRENGIDEFVDHSSTTGIGYEDQGAVFVNGKAESQSGRMAKEEPASGSNSDNQSGTACHDKSSACGPTRQALLHQQPSMENPQPELEGSLLIAVQDHSPLFKLPLEIRLQIYNMVLRPGWTEEYDTRITEWHAKSRGQVYISKSPRLGSPSVLSILLTCRRALHEAEHILYANNPLWVDDFKTLSNLGPNRRRALSALVTPVESAEVALRALERLNEPPDLLSLRYLLLIRTTTIEYVTRDDKAWLTSLIQIVAQVRKLTQLEGINIVTRYLLRGASLRAIDNEIRQAVTHRKFS